MSNQPLLNMSYSFAQLPLDAIEPHPQNDYSMTEPELRDLMDSILADGLGQLPLVRKLPDDAYQMIAGHRRLEAYRRLSEGHPNRFSAIPVNVIDGLDDARANVLLNVTNLVTRSLTQEERGARYAAIGREVPAMRRDDPSLKGVRTNEIIARIVTQETGKPISEATVKRAIAAQKRVDESRAQAEKLTGELTPDWQIEADTGRFDPAITRAISELPEKRQEKLFVEYQRREMTPGMLKNRIREMQPKTSDDAARNLATAIRCVQEVRQMKLDNVPIPQGMVCKLRSLIDGL